MLIRPFTMRITAAGIIAAVVGSGFKKAVKISAVFLLGAAGLFFDCVRGANAFIGLRISGGVLPCHFKNTPVFRHKKRLGAKVQKNGGPVFRTAAFCCGKYAFQ